MKYLDINGWSVDLATGHAAHPSGLYTYFDLCPTFSGGIRFIGPISSPHTSLKQRQVDRYSLALTLGIESDLASKSAYCLWGSYTHQLEFREHLIIILKEKFSFIPNPAYRTSLLLCAVLDNMEEHLHREWSIRSREHSVIHASGIEFQFKLSKSKLRRSKCNVRRLNETDAQTMHPQLSSTVIRALSGIAFRLLISDLEHSTKFSPKTKLQVFIESEIFNWTLLEKQFPFDATASSSA